MKKLKHYFLISVALFIGLFLSHILTLDVFINNSPKIRSNLGEYLAYKIKSKGFELASLNPFQSKNPHQLSESESKKRVNEIEQKLAGIPLQTVARGVQAKSNGDTGMKIINTEEMDKVTYEFTLRDGRKIKISIMKELIDKFGWTQEDIEQMASQ